MHQDNWHNSYSVFFSNDIILLIFQECGVPPKKLCCVTNSDPILKKMV